MNLERKLEILNALVDVELWFPRDRVYRDGASDRYSDFGRLRLTPGARNIQRS